MIINCDSKYNGGLGDTIALAWLGQAAESSLERIQFFSRDPKKRVVLEMLGMELSDDYKNAIDMSPAFEPEQKQLAKLPRWLYWVQQLDRYDLRPVCPHVGLTSFDLDWVDEKVNTRNMLQKLIGAGDRKLVLLFPQTSQHMRMWLTSHWMNLSEMLYADGFFPLVVYADSELDGMFRYSIKDCPPERIAAMMMRCALTITCDSFSAHLAATIGCGTLTLWGPSKPESVFGHCLDRIRIMRVDKSVVSCVGCNNDKKLVRPACSVACEALVMLQPKDVFAVAKEMTA